MSASIMNSTTAATVIPTPTRAWPTALRPAPRAWLVLVALVAAATLGLTLAWQPAAADVAASAAPAASTTSAVPALSPGAALLATAWELAPTAQRAQACAQYAKDPATAWASYSAAADASSIATRAEFAAFLDVTC